jgi:hypothetical protein
MLLERRDVRTILPDETAYQSCARVREKLELAVQRQYPDETSWRLRPREKRARREKPK